MSESRVTWVTSVPILILLGLSILELSPMYATDRQTDRRQTKASLNNNDEHPAYNDDSVLCLSFACMFALRDIKNLLLTIRNL